MDFSFRIEGAREVRNQLHALPGRVAGRVLRRAVNKASSPVLLQARRTLRARGYSRKTVMTVRRVNARNPTPYSVRVVVGVHQDGYYLRFIELGLGSQTISARRRATLGYYADDGRFVAFGPQVTIPARPARPFLRSAFDENIGEFVSRLADILQQEIDREIARARR